MKKDFFRNCLKKFRLLSSRVSLILVGTVDWIVVIVGGAADGAFCEFFLLVFTRHLFPLALLRHRTTELLPFRVHLFLGHNHETTRIYKNQLLMLQNYF